MAAIDFFCSADDRHRVILLVDLLERAGQEVSLRCEPLVAPTRPCLVACTRRALREPWIEALFTEANTLVAIRLDDAPLPGVCLRVIDMQAWPARSADRKVGTLVHWLEHGDAAPRRRPGAWDQPGAAARSGDLRTPRHRNRVRSKDPSLLGALAIIGVLVIGAALLSLTATEQQQGPPASGGNDLLVGSSVPPSGGSDLPIANLPSGGSDLPIANLPDIRDREIAPTVTTAPAEAVASPQQMPSPVADPRDSAPPAHADALRHLCDARTLEAALAWAGVLSWKQRHRVTDEPCVTRLLQRSGYRELERLLDLS